MNRSVLPFAFLLIVQITYAQPILLTEHEGIEFLRITPIDKEMGTIGATRKTNLKIDMQYSYEIDCEGNQIAGRGKLIRDLKGTIHAIDLPGFDLPKIGMFDGVVRFTTDDNTLILYLSTSPGGGNPDFGIVRFYDVALKEITKTYQFPNELIRFINNNGSVIAGVVQDSLLKMHVLDGDEYVDSTIATGYPLQSAMLSKTGSRIFFTMRQSTNDYRCIYVERQTSQWSTENRVTLEPLKVQNNLSGLEIVGIANDGKTLIAKTKDHHMAVVHDRNGSWSHPEYVGNFEYHAFSVNSEEIVRIRNSEDGRVIVVNLMIQQNEGKLPIPSAYSTFVFIQNAKGTWSKHKINPEKIEVVQEALLSGDGSTLFWVPTYDFSAINSEEMK